MHEVRRLRDLSPLYEMAKEGIDLEDRRVAARLSACPEDNDHGLQRQGPRPLREPPQRRLASPRTSPSVGTGIVGAPECGDVMKLQLKISDEGVIEDAKFKTFGCGSAIASSSYVTELVKGKTVDEVMAIKNTHIVEELSLPPVKIHCSVLAEDAIKAAIGDWKKKRAATPKSAQEGGREDATMIGDDRRGRRARSSSSWSTKGKPDAGLRVKVVGGGCSGLTYKMDLDDAARRRQDLRARRRQARRRPQELPLPERHRCSTTRTS